MSCCRGKPLIKPNTAKIWKITIPDCETVWYQDRTALTGGAGGQDFNVECEGDIAYGFGTSDAYVTGRYSVGGSYTPISDYPDIPWVAVITTGSTPPAIFHSVGDDAIWAWHTGSSGTRAWRWSKTAGDNPLNSSSLSTNDVVQWIAPIPGTSNALISFSSHDGANSCLRIYDDTFTSLDDIGAVTASGGSVIMTPASSLGRPLLGNIAHTRSGPNHYIYDTSLNQLATATTPAGTIRAANDDYILMTDGAASKYRLLDTSLTELWNLGYSGGYTPQTSRTSHYITSAGDVISLENSGGTYRIARMSGGTQVWTTATFSPTSVSHLLYDETTDTVIVMGILSLTHSLRMYDGSDGSQTGQHKLGQSVFAAGASAGCVHTDGYFYVASPQGIGSVS